MSIGQNSETGLHRWFSSEFAYKGLSWLNQGRKTHSKSRPYHSLVLDCVIRKWAEHKHSLFSASCEFMWSVASSSCCVTPWLYLWNTSQNPSILPWNAFVTAFYHKRKLRHRGVLSGIFMQCLHIIFKRISIWVTFEKICPSAHVDRFLVYRTMAEVCSF